MLYYIKIIPVLHLAAYMLLWYQLRNKALFVWGLLLLIQLHGIVTALFALIGGELQIIMGAIGGILLPFLLCLPWMQYSITYNGSKYSGMGIYRMIAHSKLYLLALPYLINYIITLMIYPHIEKNVYYIFSSVVLAMIISLIFAKMRFRNLQIKHDNENS